MNSLTQADRRVESYLVTRTKFVQSLMRRLCPDPRARRGVRYRLDELLMQLLLGVLVGSPSLRDVEGLGQQLWPQRRRSPSDGALANLLAMLSPEHLEPVLVHLIKRCGRRGELRPDGLDQHWVTIDGKHCALQHDAGGDAAMRHITAEQVYWHLGMLRAALVSAPGRPPLGQHVIAPGCSELSTLWSFVMQLRRDYGELCCNFTVDAGLWSKELFATFDRSGLGLFAGLKRNKPDLWQQAQRVLDRQRTRPPHAVCTEQRYRGATVVRRLWRTDQLNGYDGWNNLRQVIVVEQTTRFDDHRDDRVELRYFVTNALPGQLGAAQALTLVRRHWAIENDINWSFDVQFGEDAGAWCTQNKALQCLGVLRMIALCISQHLRKSHAADRPVLTHPRRPHPARRRPMPWRQLRQSIGRAMQTIAVALWPPPARAP